MTRFAGLTLVSVSLKTERIPLNPLYLYIPLWYNHIYVDHKEGSESHVF